MRTAICGLTAILLILGPFPLPYGYYQFLKLEAFAASIYALIFLIMNASRCADERGQFDSMNWPRVAAFALIILFNPFVSIALGKVIWGVVDVIAALYFAFIAFTQREK